MMGDPLMSLMSFGRRHGNVGARVMRTSLMACALTVSLFLMRHERTVLRPATRRADQVDFAASVPNDQKGLQNPSGFASSLDGDAPNCTYFLPNSSEFVELTRLRNAMVQSKPAVVIVPKKVSEVEEAVRYAKRRKARVSVISTGHDYDGRSVGEDSVNINMREMRWATFIDDDLMSVGPGTTWMEVYEASLERGMAPLSGYDSSVGVAGFTMGGGHGPLSRLYGLGADHLVGATVVDGDGTAQNVDGEWLRALRGGGGGTFGVVVEMILKLEKAPKRVDQLTYAVQLTGRRPNALTRFMHNATFLESIDEGWAGWNQLECGNDEDDSSVWLVGIYLHSGYDASQDPLEIGQPMRDFYDELASLSTSPNGEDVRVDTFDSMMGFEKKYGSLPLGRYRRQFIGNVFMDSQALSRNSDRLTDYLMDSMLTTCAPGGRRELFVYYNNVLGGNVPTADGANETAVSPGFRNAIFEVGPNAYWKDPKLDRANVEASAALARGLYMLSDSSYLNEWTSARGDNVMSDWRKRFWGDDENYDKLLRVKHKVDPCNMFWVPHGVGSDEPVYSEEAADCGVASSSD